MQPNPTLLSPNHPKTPSAWNYYISQRWAKLRGWRAQDRQCCEGANAALEADTHRKDSFVTLVSDPHVIARSVCVCVCGRARITPNFGCCEAASLLIPREIHCSVSPSSSALPFSLTTKCSLTGGTWWLWWIHMKTCQWRYEAPSSV